MSQTMLTFQVPLKTKQSAKKKSAKLGVSLSEYLRGLVESDLDIKNVGNPWLEMADGINGILTEDEVEEMLDNIKKSRVNRSEESWDKIVKIVGGA